MKLRKGQTQVLFPGLMFSSKRLGASGIKHTLLFAQNEPDELDKNTFQIPSVINTCARILAHARMDDAFTRNSTYFHSATFP